MSSPGQTLPATELAGRLASAKAQAAAAYARSGEPQQRTTRMLTAVQAARRTSAEARRQRWSSPAGRDLLHASEYARLLARLESLPVIEQAKGILSGLWFADSAMVQALVLAARTLKRRGGTLVLLHPQQPVTRVLALTGADQMFTIRGKAHGEPEPESEAG